ncbi:YhdP family protein [Thiobacter aerophilum]|uniref:YhdP family protein n=1 Tax=Thiobacter aerophilum TaxID=3121275 RepID=A0ABV0EC19_9BURK
MKAFSIKAAGWAWRLLVAAGLLVTVLAAGMVLALRYWVLPDLGRYREDLAGALSRAAGQPIRISGLEGDWQGLWPRLTLLGVTVLDVQGKPALTLERVDTQLSWQTLLAGELRLKRLELDAPSLTIRREPDGLIYVSGIPVNRPGARAGLADWILRQGEIRIRHARIEWEDRLRDAPPLVFEDVGLRLDNEPLLARHRFGLVARPPASLASQLDLRGDLRGRSFDDLTAWRGTLYARVPATDLAAWAHWLTFPYPVREGKGGVQAWIDIDHGRITGVTADLHLGAVRTRLAQALPELDLASLRGRIVWRDLVAGFELQARGLAAEGPGLRLPAASLSLRYEAARGRQPEKGRLQAEGVALEPLRGLAMHLPLSATQRATLEEVAPRGLLRQLTLTWEGPLEAPARYSAKASFSELGIEPWRKLPGFSNLTGSLDVDEKGGTLQITGRNSAFHLPLVMRNPVGFDTLEAAASWRVRDGRIHLALSRAAFANADAAGAVSGSYESVPDGPGWVDLTGGLTRANARAVHLYLPRVVGQDTHDWLRDALLAGQLSDVKMRIRGDLAKFPFAGEGDGLFQVTGRAQGVRLAYAPGWPQAENISGSLEFRGSHMEMVASQALISNVRLPRVKAVIPDLSAPEEILQLEGEAEGATADVLRFIQESPLAAWMDHFLDHASAEGGGRLALRLTLPLRASQRLRLTGNYQFFNNTLRLSPELPLFRQLNGRLDFTEKSLTAPRLTLETLGGPASLSLTTLGDGTLRVTASGRLTADGVRAFLPAPLDTAVQGGTGWSLSLALRDHLANLNLASDLVGLECALPAPLSKRAAEALPLRIERRALDAKQDALSLVLDQVVSAQVVRRLEDGEMRVLKGTVRLGGRAAPAPVHPGVWVDGELPALDVDAWRAALDGASGDALPLAGVHLRVAALDFLGRRFKRVHLNAWSQGSQWQATVDGDELEGAASWRSHDGGRLMARLKRLVVPDPLPERRVAPAGGRDVDLPGLDVVVEELNLAHLELGRLELEAVKRGQDWRIEKFRLANSDAVLGGTGSWQSWLAQPATRLGMELEVKDVGRLLARMGHPDRIRRGTARVKGELAWRGGPASFNLATLSGTLKLEAHSGQFLKIEPGLGKLLGLLSLQSLPRRLTLDFRDVFSEGFAFDNIAGTSSISDGVLTTQDFVMQGPAALVTISGSTDLVRETQNLRIRIVPSLGEGVAVAGAFLGGPVVGVTALLLQKLLKDPVGQLIAYEYQVSGTWDDPQVVKLGQVPAKEAVGGEARP